MKITRLSKFNLINILLLFSISILITVIVVEPFDNQEHSEIRLTSLAAEIIDNIVISRESRENIVLKQQTRGNRTTYWKMISPIEIPANDFRINKLLEILNTDVKKRFQPEPDSLSRYGLRPSRWQISFNDLKLEFGDAEPVSKLRYVMVEDSVNLIEDRFSQYNYDSPLSLVSLQLLPEGDAIQSISYNDWTVSNSDGDWKLETAPLTVPGSAEKAVDSRQETLKEYIEHWREAEAIRVTKITEEFLNHAPSGKDIQISLASSSQPTRFTIIKNKESILFVNRDNLLTYLVSSSTHEELTIPLN